ncbi:MAG: patatin-like phospholipase family protein, partial [Pseudomonadota bacterium]
DKPARSTAAPGESLAVGLQGGGAFGSYSWGVLDYLLAETEANFAVLTGASAGALNAAVFASGYAAGGRDGARRALLAVWDDVLKTARSEAPGAAAAFAASRFASMFGPEQRMRLSMEPMRRIIERHVDFDAVARGPVPVFISAVRVRDWEPRIFTGANITADVVAASCCLPAFHEDVRVDGEPHWDGGYAANPPLPPLKRGRRRLVVALTPPRPGAEPATQETAASAVRPAHFSAPFAQDLARLKTWTPEIIDATPHLPAFRQAGAPTRRLLDRLFACGRADAARWAATSARAAE